VPYKWPGGTHPEHVHDPVDEKKLRNWMGRAENYSMIVREPFGSVRLIAYYDIDNPEARIDMRTAREAKMALWSRASGDIPNKAGRPE
jgi:hypothetical protein